MDGQFLIKSRIQSPVQSYTKPTKGSAPVDKTARTVELEKGMQPPMLTRETSPSITLGSM